MLGRKSSFGGAPISQGPAVGMAGPASGVTGGVGGLLSLDHPSSMYHSNADYGPSDETHEGSDIIWFNRKTTRRFLRGLALLSLLSVMLNTPKTFMLFPSLIYVTYMVDTVIIHRLKFYHIFKFNWWIHIIRSGACGVKLSYKMF